MIKNVKKVLKTSCEYKTSKVNTFKNFIDDYRVYYPGHSNLLLGQHQILTTFALQQMYYGVSKQFKTGIYFSTSQSNYSVIEKLCFVENDIISFSKAHITPMEKDIISNFREELKNEKKLYFVDDCTEVEEMIEQTEKMLKKRKIDFIIIDRIDQTTEYNPTKGVIFKKLRKFANRNSILVTSLIDFNFEKNGKVKSLNFEFAKKTLPFTKYCDNIEVLHPKDLVTDMDEDFYEWKNSEEVTPYILNGIKWSEGGFAHSVLLHKNSTGKMFLEFAPKYLR